MGHPRKVDKLAICATMVIGDGCLCSVCQVKRKPGECSTRGAIQVLETVKKYAVVSWVAGS